MSNFLEQLDNLSNARNDTAQLYEDIENFANRYFEEIANNLLERLKKEILDSAQKGNFSYENGRVSYTIPKFECSALAVIEF